MMRFRCLPLALLAACCTPVFAAPRVHTVAIENMRFVPETLEVRQGDTVVWVNRDPFPHTATAEGKGFDSRSIAPERSWKYVARRRGDFPYLCTLHTTMRGKLTVR